MRENQAVSASDRAKRLVRKLFTTGRQRADHLELRRNGKYLAGWGEGPFLAQIATFESDVRASEREKERAKILTLITGEIVRSDEAFKALVRAIVTDIDPPSFAGEPEDD